MQIQYNNNALIWGKKKVILGVHRTQNVKNSFINPVIPLFSHSKDNYFTCRM